MARLVALLTVLTIGLIGASPSHAEEHEPGFYAKTYPMTLRNPEEVSSMELAIFAKSFCVAMRRFHNREDKSDLRGFIDPRYLNKHEVMEDSLPIDLAAVVPVHNCVIAEDLNTVLCIVGTAEDGNSQVRTKEAIILRTTVYDGKLYLSPGAPPDSKTGLFTPWILRTKL